MKHDREFDLICMGRAAVDLYSEQIGVSLEKTSSFAKYVGGCPANIAIGSARLGLKTAMLTRVGNEAMGRFVKETLSDEGVDISHVTFDEERLTGLVLLGIIPPDHFPLIFFRENCADMAIDKGDFSVDFFKKATALLVTGTHCSTPHAFEVTCHAIELAKNAGTQIILDIDYRPVLWNALGHGDGETRYIKNSILSERLQKIIPSCDMIVGTEEELLAATDKTTVAEALKTLRSWTKNLIIQKRGEKGCLVYPENESSPITGTAFPVTVLNVLGAGDAFLSGFLRGYLKGLPLQECCSLANGNGALVVTRHGCSPAMPYWKELHHFIHHPHDILHVEQLHRKNMDLCILAFDHRKYFEDLSVRCHAKQPKISEFKNLIFQALKNVHKMIPGTNIGIIVDDQYGDATLNEAQKEPLFIARCIEAPNSYPLQFLEGKSAADILREWPPNTTVKVLCYVSNEADIKDQLPKLKELYEATQKREHPLLIELIERESETLKNVTSMIAACYAQNIHPAWWKLQPFEDTASWGSIHALIEKEDPQSCGVLLLGESRPLEEIGHLLEKLSGRYKRIKGFAIGRTVWSHAAEQWFEGKISDAAAIEQIAERFTCMVNSWHCVPTK